MCRQLFDCYESTECRNCNSSSFTTPDISEYKDEIFSEFTEEITSYTYSCPAQTIVETESMIKNSIQELQNGTKLHTVVLAKDSQEFLGCAGLFSLDKEPRFAIWIKKAAQGNKYGLEAITVLKDWADKNLDNDYIIYPVDKNNIASRKIPEALGGQVIKEYEQPTRSGKILYALEYRIYKKLLK